MRVQSLVLAVAAGLLSGLVVSAETKMTRAEFDRLSPDQMIDVGKKKMSKREFLAEMDRLRAQAQGASRVKPTEQSLNAVLANALRVRITADNARLPKVTAVPPPDFKAQICESPRITSIEYSAPLEPGEWFNIHGCGFGAQRGTLFMGNSEVGFIGQYWGPFVIQGQVDPALSGVLDQQTTVSVRTKDLKMSNAMPVQFRAAREAKRLHAEDVTVVCDGDYPDNCKFRPNETILTTHARHAGYGLGNNNVMHIRMGTDSLSASLKNGWILTSATAEQILPNDPPQNNRIAAMGGFQPGTSSTQLHIVWMMAVMDGDGLEYITQLWAEGIRGTPYK